MNILVYRIIGTFDHKFLISTVIIIHIKIIMIMIVIFCYTVKGDELTNLTDLLSFPLFSS